ncbi:hypothetical protein GF373_09055 [bacterium]|nr:hypothetical protein [bacterium]
MNPKITALFAGCIILIVLLLVFWEETPVQPIRTNQTSQIQQTPVDKSEITAEENVQATQPPVRVESHEGGQAATGDDESPQDSVGSSPLVGQATPKEASFLHVRITDALDHPISRGTLRVNQVDHSFSQGQVKLDRLPTGPVQLAAKADGYRDATKTVKWPKQTDVNLVLEYLTEFECEVMRLERGRPKQMISHADVLVWKIADAVRPVRSGITLSVSAMQNRVHLTLLRTQKGIHISQTSPNLPKREFQGVANPQPGDSLLGMEGITYRQGDSLQYAKDPKVRRSTIVSPQLRIWDALALYQVESSASSTMLDGIIEFKRNGKHYFTNLLKIDTSGLGQPMLQAKSDARGKCTLEPLPPGMYVAQARKGQGRTNFAVLHPCRLSSVLYYKDGCELMVRVLRTKSALPTHNAVVGAEVSLRSVEGSGILMRTTNQIGSARFETCPFGSFQLTVTPPESYSLPSVNKVVKLQDSKHSLTVYLGKGVNVSGRVLHKQTREPISGFPIQLLRAVDETHGLRHAGLIGTTESGADGMFTFTDVLPGEYILSMPMHKSQKPEYLPSEQIWAPGHSITKRELAFQVAKKDVTELEYLVVPAVETHFLGFVENREEERIPHAEISLERERFVFLEEKPRTDENGDFSLSILTAEDFPPQNTVISSHVGQEKKGLDQQNVDEAREGERTGGSSGEIEYPGRKKIPDDKNIDMWGEAPLSFSPGRDVENIRIVVDSPEDHICLRGQLIAEEAGKPMQVDVVAFQNGLIIPGMVNEDGSYRISWIDPGPFVLKVIPKITQKFIPRFGEKPYMAYCEETVDLVMPENSVLTHNVRLTPCAHVGGFVFDANNNPASDMKVIVQSQVTASPTNTDRRGMFWVGGLRPENTFSIIVQNLSDGKTVLQKEGVKANDTNIILRLPAP